MDNEAFDHLVQRFEMLTSRRATLGAIVGAGLGGALLDAAAKGKKKKKCNAKSICPGKCGSVKPKKCKKAVDCGDCPACQRCNAGTCEPDPDQEKLSCGASKVCREGACVDCGFIDAPCCANGACVPFIGSVCSIDDICTKCGKAGELCCAGRDCDGDLTCQGSGDGGCVA